MCIPFCLNVSPAACVASNTSISTEFADGGVGFVAGVERPSKSAACCYKNPSVCVSNRMQKHKSYDVLKNHLPGSFFLFQHCINDINKKQSEYTNNGTKKKNS